MLPAVSVVMPVRDEERHLADSVACVLEQEYPGGFELVLAIGPSKDRTEAIAREKQLKGWTRAKKLNLIRKSNPTSKDLAETWTYERLGPAQPIPK